MHRYGARASRPPYRGCLVRVFSWAIPLALIVSCATPPDPEPAPSVPIVVTTPLPETSIGSLRVTASSLNVRSAPQTTAVIVTSVKKGSRLDLLKREGEWSRVRLSTGETGWVFSKHVRAERGCPPDREFSLVSAPPLAFSDAGAHGKVTVEATVDKTGTVISTKVVANTSGSEELGSAAEREIRLARFEPPIRKCVPVKFIYVYRRDY